MARLIFFIILFALFLIFIGLNLNNHCDVNLGFYAFDNAPVYVTAMASFFLGMLCTLPIFFSLKKKEAPKQAKEKPEKKKKKTPHAEQDEIPKENGPYGID